MHWSGWESIEQAFGLELQDPWAGAVVDGKKLIETRSYSLPPSLIGKKIMIIQFSSGQAGVCSLGNCINLSRTEKAGGNKIIGWCVFLPSKCTQRRKSFEAKKICIS